MKSRLLGILLATTLAVSVMTGCKTAKTVERNAESVGNALIQSPGKTAATASGQQRNPELTLEEAQNIALKHAGFTADQVMALHTEYELAYGIPQYDVEFHYGAWEYDYDIHADTGEILSYSKDD